MVDANWGDDDEPLDIDDEILGAEGDDGVQDEAGDSDIFVAPSVGQDPLQAGIRKNPTNAALHVSVGNFEKALDLLKN